MIFKNYSFNYFDIYDSILLEYLPIPFLLLHIISLNQLFIQNLYRTHVSHAVFISLKYDLLFLQEYYKFLCNRNCMET